jgi:hypothetical protein
MVLNLVEDLTPYMFWIDSITSCLLFADFYDSIPFTVPFLAFLLIYSSIATVLAELMIKFIKKYA